MFPPFKPLASISLRFMTLKVVFLVVIISARCVSEVAALSVCQDLCIFHQNRVVLQMEPSFVPKVNSLFFRSGELVLLDFCLRPQHRLEVKWHTFDVQRALCRYVKRTAPFRKSEALFVSFLPASMGRKVSSATVSRWLKACIATAYTLKNRPPPGRILPHSTRSASTTAAWATQWPTFVGQQPGPPWPHSSATTKLTPSPQLRHPSDGMFCRLLSLLCHPGAFGLPPSMILAWVCLMLLDYPSSVLENDQV